MTAQWVHLDERCVLVADAASSRFGRPDLGSPSHLAPMPSSWPGDVDSMRNLLDGAIAAGERGPARTERRPTPSITPARWAWFLAGQWYSALHSLELMRAAVQRFRAEGRSPLAAFAERKLRDEEGHEQLPLRDLRSLGYDADALVRGVEPDPGVVMGIEHARSLLEGPVPVEFLGYVYALERRMMRIPLSLLDVVDSLLPAGAAATAGLRLHAGELDGAHVEQAVALLCQLPADERAALARGAFATARIRRQALDLSQDSEEELVARLVPFARPRVPTGEEQVQ